MKYSFFVIPKHLDKLRRNIFLRMQEESLLKSTMHAFENPSEDDWLMLTDASKGWLVCCVPKNCVEHNVENICGIAWLEPWRGQVWHFDFTVFREHFAHAICMSNAVLAWIYNNAPCTSIVGLCAKSNAHAWRLAHKSGFTVLGHIPGACYQAKRKKYEDGVLVFSSKESFFELNQARAQSKSLCR